MFEWLSNIVNPELLNSCYLLCETSQQNLLVKLNKDNIILKKYQYDQLYETQNKDLLDQERELTKKLDEITSLKRKLYNEHCNNLLKIQKIVIDTITDEISKNKLCNSITEKYNIEYNKRKIDFENITSLKMMVDYICIYNHWYCDDKEKLIELMNILIKDNIFTFEELKNIFIKCVCYKGTYYNKDNKIWQDIIINEKTLYRRMNACRSNNFSSCYNIFHKVITLNSEYELKIEEKSIFNDPIISIKKKEGINEIEHEYNTAEEYINSLIENLK